MYPRNIAEASISPEEAASLAARHMQTAPYTARAERRAVMHQPEATIPVLPPGYLRTAPAPVSPAPETPEAAQTDTVADAAIRQETPSLTDQSASSAQAAEKAKGDLAEKAMLILQAAQMQASKAQNAQMKIAAAIKPDSAEAVKAAAEIAGMVTQAMPPVKAAQITQALRAEMPGSVALAALRTLLEKAALTRKAQLSQQSDPAIVPVTAAPADPVAAHTATAPDVQTIPAVPTVAPTPDVPLMQTISTALEAILASDAPPVQAQPAVSTTVPAATPTTQAVPAAPETVSTLDAPPLSDVRDTIPVPATPETVPTLDAPPLLAVRETIPVLAVTAAQVSPATPAAVPAASASNDAAALHFCTVTGSSYLFKVVTLYRSLEAHSGDFMLYVCCIDGETQTALNRLRLPRCISVSVDALGDSGLSALRSQRSASEFCWTLKSHFLNWLLTEKGLPDAVYLDSDVAFFSNPQRLYDDWGNAAVYLCRQRDLDWVEQKYGKYQAGVIGFRNNEQGLAAVRWWQDKCRAWCFAAPESGQYGDQKYLDEIPALFGSVRISTHRGIDAAPWNTVYNNNYPVNVSGSEITIDGDPLVAYHFACLDVIDEQHFDLWNLSGITISPTISNAVYLPYLAKLRDSIAEVQAKTGGRYYAHKTFNDAKTPYIYSKNNLSITHWDGVFGFCTIASKQYAARTLALYRSLEKHAGNFHMWICCMDDKAYAILSSFSLANATLIMVSDVETPEVRATRASKKLYEYCWTMKPLLCQHVFDNYNISRLLYCDADMYFFASPQAIHNEWRRYETFLNLQRGSAQLEAVHGMYQAGLIGFTKAAESLRTLSWWARQCTAWCYDNHDDHSRWGDQKYLTQIPNLFSSIKVNNRYGLLAAPWNIVMNNSKDLPVHTDSAGTVWIGDESLTCFHFGSINVLSENSFDLWKHDPLNFDPAILESIYKPYLGHLRSIYGEISARGFNISELFENGAGAQNPFAL